MDVLNAEYILRELDGQSMLGSTVYLAAQRNNTVVGAYRDIGTVDVTGVHESGLHLRRDPAVGDVQSGIIRGMPGLIGRSRFLGRDYQLIVHRLNTTRVL